MPLRDLAKGGWHPGKGDGMGKGTSARGDFKGVNQIAGLLGKGKDTTLNAEKAHQHHSAPLSTLKDPATFGPPPRHTARAEVKSPTITPTITGRSATSSRAVFPESKVLATAPKSDSWGTPLPVTALEEQQAQGYGTSEEDTTPKPPPVPYRANTTGLSTAGLPAPPVRKFQPEDETAVPQMQRSAPVTKVAPKPPPRLPPRQNSNPNEFSEAPPPSYTAATTTATQQVPPQTGSGYLNKASLNRLGHAGVSVPRLDIGRSASPQTTQHGSITASPQATTPSSASQMNELQSRFSRLPGRVSSPTVQGSQAANSSTGTTWQQKQAALTTANKFQKDPSSVSFSDAREAGSTINNFRQRHGEQVAQGMQQAQTLDKKHGVSGRVGGWAQAQQQQPAMETATAPVMTPTNMATSGKKPPPPPPKKKVTLSSDSVQDAPPPVPMSSKPRQ